MDNHSSALVFEPKDDDEKDYIQVTAYINEEFAAIRQEEKEETNTTQKTTQKTRDIILHLMKLNPNISQEEIVAFFCGFCMYLYISSVWV